MSEPQDRSRIEPRVSSLETEVKSLRGEVAGLADSFRQFAEQIRRDVSTLGRTNWGTIISAVGLAVVIIGALGSAVVAPISGEIRAQATLSDQRMGVFERSLSRGTESSEKNANKISELFTELRGLSEAFKEVETQFRWGTDVRNVRDRNFDRTLSILWHKVFGDSLPDASLPNVGPNAKASNGNGKN